MKVNLYCDESCHLEHDNETHMVIGGIKCPQVLRKQICQDIIDIKEKYKIPKYAEIKWNKVSSCNLDYFKAIVDYFFSCDDLSFRAIIVDKTKLDHDSFHQTHDDFYYKMYYQCLVGLIEAKEENYIYLDKKDTKGAYRVQKLKFYLGQKLHDFDESIIKRIQCSNSTDLPLLQLADLLIGAIGYRNRQLSVRSAAKIDLVNHIIKSSGYALNKSTLITENKFNLFFINLQ